MGSLRGNQEPYDVEQLARSLIPDHEGADRSWRGYARTFFTAVTRQAHEAGVTDVGELYRLLVVADAQRIARPGARYAAQPFLDEAQQPDVRFHSLGHEFRRSARSTTSRQQKATRFSIREWVNGRDRRACCFIPYKAGQIAALRSTISGWMRLAIFETMDQGDEPHRHDLWFVVDELDALGQIDGLKDALARLRKFNGRCVLGFQSIAQVSSTYGPGDAHTIVENCGNTLILRCSASEGGGTARFASQLIGEREVLRTTVSRSRRVTELLGSISQSAALQHRTRGASVAARAAADLNGYLKYASDPSWVRVRLDARQAWERRRPSAGLRRGPAASLRVSGADHE